MLNYHGKHSEVTCKELQNNGMLVLTSNWSFTRKKWRPSIEDIDHQMSMLPHNKNTGTKKDNLSQTTKRTLNPTKTCLYPRSQAYIIIYLIYSHMISHDILILWAQIELSLAHASAKQLRPSHRHFNINVASETTQRCDNMWQRAVYVYGGFPEMGYHQNGWFVMQNPIQLDTYPLVMTNIAMV